MKIAIPVIITLIIDASLTRFLEHTHGSVSLDRSFSETMTYSSGGVDPLNSLWIALILIGVIVLVTIVMLVLYLLKCVKVIIVWLGFSVALMMSFFVWSTFRSVPEILNIPMDYVSGVILLLNLAVVSVMAVFWRAPKIATQLVMIAISILVALVFLYLPDITVWILLGVLVIYDCCVVLCPHGLLKVIIEKSEERGDTIPALLYASSAWISNEEEEFEENNDSDSSSSSGAKQKTKQETKRHKRSRNHKIYNEEEDLPELDVQEDPYILEDDDVPPPSLPPPRPARAPAEKPQQSVENSARKRKKFTGEETEDGLKLGLGDFVFYGILVCRAARLGWDIIILVVFAVILGLAVTLICLAIFQRALPALPFSLVLGVLFFITGAMTFRPFDLNLRNTQIVF